jgi:thiamine-monophosphate kinase
MKLSEIGEFALIDILANLVQKDRDVMSPGWKNLVAGIGDDAAAWKNSANLSLATTDCLVQDVHFRLGQTSWRDLGWKALAVNLSDIAAMGGTAEHALVTLGLPGETGVEDITELYKGMIEIGIASGVAIAGGDVTSSSAVFISLTVLGSAGDRILRRCAARGGELIAVTGYPGMAAAGMALINGKAKPDGETPALTQAFLRPSPRLGEGKIILEAGVQAAIDISDGLVADLGHLCRASGVSAQIETERVPLHPALRRAFPDRALDMALGGGEDYELLFTASAAAIEAVKARTSLPVSVIGEITTGNTGLVRVLDSHGNEYPLKKAGWDHFGTA